MSKEDSTKEKIRTTATKNRRNPDDWFSWRYKSDEDIKPPFDKRSKKEDREKFEEEARIRRQKIKNGEL